MMTRRRRREWHSSECSISPETERRTLADRSVARGESVGARGYATATCRRHRGRRTRLVRIRPRPCATVCQHVCVDDDTMYSQHFYASRQAAVTSSAAAVVPFLVDRLKPRSVVDFGCGTGTWLKHFLDLGVDRVLGIDGPHVDAQLLEIPPGSFRRVDLRDPANVAERFDLALCMEVAEHLPPSRAESLVAELTRAAPSVLFGAAIPGQGGTGHINERWQSYWADLFAHEGYIPDDALRRRFWDDHPRVTYHYSQNTLLYSTTPTSSTSPLSVAHPHLAESLIHRLTVLEAEVTKLRSPGIGSALRSVPGAAVQTLRRRVGRGRRQSRHSSPQ